ncbi:MAG: hypothetical protein OSJ27_10745, partial [Candidatus Gastranaerophilales bacterium]|nr:hypothetical protein [Candidatus Gastranaerophilales bacterium]
TKIKLDNQISNSKADKLGANRAKAVQLVQKSVVTTLLIFDKNQLKIKLYSKNQRAKIQRTKIRRTMLRCNDASKKNKL